METDEVNRLLAAVIKDQKKYSYQQMVESLETCLGILEAIKRTNELLHKMEVEQKPIPPGFRTDYPKY